jgi:hypothetical protein
VTQDRAAGPASTAAAASIMVVANALTQTIESGKPFANEVTALENLNADKAKIAILKPFAAAGVATPQRLKEEFAPLATRILADQPVKAEDGLIGRWLSSAGNLVRVRKIDDGSSDDQGALITRIETTLDRHDIAAALAAWTKLPPPAKAISEVFAQHAKASTDAATAARAIKDEAVALLGKPKS